MEAVPKSWEVVGQAARLMVVDVAVWEVIAAAAEDCVHQSYCGMRDEKGTCHRKNLVEEVQNGRPLEEAGVFHMREVGLEQG